MIRMEGPHPSIVVAGFNMSAQWADGNPIGHRPDLWEYAEKTIQSRKEKENARMSSVA